MRTEHIRCDASGCEASTTTREAYDWLRVHVQADRRKFWADLCSWECGASFFRERGAGATEGIEEETE